MNETKTQLIQTGFTLDRLHQDSKIDNEAYTILKDRNRQAINYSQCCKSDSELLPSFLYKSDGGLYFKHREDADITEQWNEYLKTR